MIYREISLMEDSQAKLCVYIQEKSEELKEDKRPFIILCPGGGYRRTSDREAEPVAIRLMSMGINVAVLRYSVSPAVFPAALKELDRAVKLADENAESWNIDKNRLMIMGFSAGGHLAASYGVFWNREDICRSGIKPAALILGYPVISSEKEYIHSGSFEHLMGDRREDAGLSELLSLEKQVGAHTPKTFIWNTYADETVPAMNSILWAEALIRNGIPVELHMYERGCHGLSLADERSESRRGGQIQKECQNWTELLKAYIENI